MPSRVFSDYFTTWHEGMAMSKTAVAAVRAGYGVIPVRPGGKVPLCTLTALQRSRDKGHACGVSHVITDATVAKRVFDRLAVELGMQPNIGIVAAPSRLVVVDADTPEAVASFLGQWAQATENSRYLQHSPTVSTPGSLVDGQWRHKDGGHWYFDVPEGIELPEYPTQLRGADGFEVRWGNQMTVAPPSTRPEGPYISNGDALEIPHWLLLMIQDAGARRAEHIRDLTDRFVNDNVVAWSLHQSWGALLVADGWDDTTKLDTCGCPIFEKPGGGTSSRKSATAHDAHCSAPIYQNIEGHGALHLWTDDPPEPLASWMTRTGKRTMTLFEYVTLARYDGDEVAAKVGEGIEIDFASRFTTAGTSAQSDSAPDPYTSVVNGGKEKGSDQGVSREEQQLLELADVLSAETGYEHEKVMRDVAKDAYDIKRRARVAQIVSADSGDGSSWNPVSTEAMLASLHRDRSVTSGEGVLIRSDGATLWPVGQVHQIYGQSSAGKTFCGMKAMHQQTQLGHRVLYCDFEDTLDTFIDRYYLDLGIDVEPLIAGGLLQYCNPLEAPGDFAALVAAQYRMVLVDSMTEVLGSVSEGSINDALLIRRVMHAFRHLAVNGASVVIVNHGSEKVEIPGSAMGSSNFRSGLTGQDVLLHERIPFDDRHAGRSLLYIAKDRGSRSSSDADLNLRASNKVQRRLWGAMEVAPTFDELLGRWVTAIDIEPATHSSQEVPKERKIDIAERLVIDYLRKRRDESAVQARIIDDIVDENEGLADRTVRRAIQQLEDDRMVHVTGEVSIGGRPSPVIKLGPAPEPAPEEGT